MQRRDGASKRDIRGVQLLVHRGRQASGDIPVVGFGEDVAAADKLYAAVTYFFAVLDLEALALVLRRILARSLVAHGHDMRRCGDVVSVTPILKHEGGAVMAEQLGVQAFKKRYCFDARNEGAIPALLRIGLCVGTCREAKQRYRTEYDPEYQFHLMIPMFVS